MRALIIDDEAAAREVLSSLLLRFAPDIEIVGEASNLLKGVELIQKFKPQVVFLDVQMPNYYGYEINKFFDEIDFQIIFITAYDEYAIKAFELAALDYLLKPIDFERLKESLTRLRVAIDTEKINNKIGVVNENLESDYPSKMTIIDKGFNSTIELNDIVAFEGQSAYSKVYLINGKSYTQSKNLKQIGGLINSHPDFFRSHKSWLINKKHVQDFSKSKQTIRLNAGVDAKISRDKMEDFVKWTQL